MCPGVQLLCMIGKGSQACRYLISYNQWEEAVRLAKCTLSKDDCDTVLKSWTDHLLSNRNQVIVLILTMVMYYTCTHSLHFSEAILLFVLLAYEQL